MAKILEDCWTAGNISVERKNEFFTKLRDLCCLYGVHIGVDDLKFQKNF